MPALGRTSQELPPEADAFLARIATLPESRWEEIIGSSRPRFGQWLKASRKILWDVVSFPFRRRRRSVIGQQVSNIPMQRVLGLAMSQRLPVHLSWRVWPMVYIATYALCSRSRLSPRDFARYYAPFEAVIPAASLGSEAPPLHDNA